MKKEKKITIKFFLNKLLEPATGDKGEKYYPLYIQVTYNRKNMQFKSKYGMYYGDLKEVKSGLMQFEERILRKAITYESNLSSSDYDLKGLKHKYEIYSTSILESLEKYLKPKLRLAILKTNDDLTEVLDFSQSHATVARLYRASQLLFTNIDSYLNAKLKTELNAYLNYTGLYKMPIFTFTFPTIMDWIEGSYKADLQTKIKTAFKNRPEILKDVYALIDAAIVEYLKRIEL
ncbi:MAG: hypothetical protein ACLQQ4_13665 [Bacteroidia bacterium]